MKRILLLAALFALMPKLLRGENLPNGQKVACQKPAVHTAGGMVERCLLANDQTFTNVYPQSSRTLPEISCRAGSMAVFDRNGNLTLCLLAHERVFRNQYASVGAKAAWTLEIGCEGSGLVAIDSSGNVTMCVLTREREFVNAYSLDLSLTIPCAAADVVLLGSNGELAACSLSRAVTLPQPGHSAVRCRGGENITVGSNGVVNCGGVIPMPVPTSAR